MNKNILKLQEENKRLALENLRELIMLHKQILLGNETRNDVDAETTSSVLTSNEETAAELPVEKTVAEVVEKSDELFDFDEFLTVFEHYKPMLMNDYSEELAKRAAAAVAEVTNGVVNVRFDCLNKYSTVVMTCFEKKSVFADYLKNECHNRRGWVGISKTAEIVSKVLDIDADVRETKTNVYTPTDNIYKIVVSRERPDCANVPVCMHKLSKTLGSLKYDKNNRMFIQTSREHANNRSSQFKVSIIQNGHGRTRFGYRKNVLKANNMFYQIVKNSEGGWGDSKYAEISICQRADSTPDQVKYDILSVEK